MTPPRKYINEREYYVDKFQGQWLWISLDPLHRTRQDYIKKFLPKSKFDFDCLACEYASKQVTGNESRCHHCFVNLGENECDELVNAFARAVYEKDEDNAARIAWEIGTLPIKKEDINNEG